MTYLIERAKKINEETGHFFWKNGPFHKSKPVNAVMSASGAYIYVVERFRAHRQVQTLHSEVIRLDTKTGEVSYMTFDKPTSEMVNGVYVKNGDRHHYRTNQQAMRAATRMAKVS